MTEEKKTSIFTNIGSDAIESLERHMKEPQDKYPIKLRIQLHLHTVLTERKLKQRDLVRMTGLRPNAVSNIYRRFPERLAIEHIERIANALNITDIRELITLVEEEDHDFYQVGLEGHVEVDE